MRVIKPGVLRTETLCHGTCRYCGAQVEYTIGEARDASDQREGEAFVVMCPTNGCGQEIWGTRIRR